MVKASGAKQKTTTATTLALASAGLARLHTWNVWLAIVFLAQGLLVLLSSATRLFPVEIPYLTRDPIGSELAGHQVLTVATKHLTNINLAYVVAAIFFVAAIAHMIQASLYSQGYEADLKKGINKVRWVEYSLGGGLLFVALGLLIGVTSAATLLLLFGMAVIVGLMRLVIELYRNPQGTAKVQDAGKFGPNHLLSGISMGAGIVLWLVIAGVIWGASVYGSGGLPGFVYILAGSTLAFCLAFGVLLYLQSRGKGSKWTDALYSERMFIILSFTAKTTLMWQIVMGALRP